jgi:hypothetical protein
VWLPTGVAIVALLISVQRRSSHLRRRVSRQLRLGRAGRIVPGIAAGNTLGTGGRISRDAVRVRTRGVRSRADIFKFAALAAIAAPLSATIGVSTLALDDPAVRAQFGGSGSHGGSATRPARCCSRRC